MTQNPKQRQFARIFILEYFCIKNIFFVAVSHLQYWRQNYTRRRNAKSKEREVLILPALVGRGMGALEQ